MKEDHDGIRCFNYNQRGHIALKCPSSAALFCEESESTDHSNPSEDKEEVFRLGILEGVPVGNILLDTGGTRTLVQGSLLLQQCLVEGKDHRSLCPW